MNEPEKACKLAKEVCVDSLLELIYVLTVECLSVS